MLENKNPTYIQQRIRDKLQIKRLYNKYKTVEFGSHNWLVINGKTFNGFTKEQFERIINATEEDILQGRDIIGNNK